MIRLADSKWIIPVLRVSAQADTSIEVSLRASAGEGRMPAAASG
jgi:hypothetical protein